jgi:hypothetical protein
MLRREFYDELSVTKVGRILGHQHRVRALTSDLGEGLCVVITRMLVMKERNAESFGCRSNALPKWALPVAFSPEVGHTLN